VGDVDARRLLHLQCHIGLDSISWARLGAHVTAVDFSPTATAKVSQLAAQARTPVEVITADVCALPVELYGGFDIAVATYGIFCWIGDLSAWARNAAAALRPGGRLVVVDGHPLMRMIDQAEPLIVDFPYGDTGPHISHSSVSYAATEQELGAGATVQWAHSVGEIVTAVAASGLRIDEVREPLTSELNIRPDVLTADAHGHWGLNVWPKPLPVLLALTATKPE
jgi:SAM-dependent methyltransferase